MLDINLIRDNPQAVRTSLLKRMDSVDFTELLAWDKKRRELITESDRLKAERNAASARIPQMKKTGEDPNSLLAAMKVVGNTIKEMDDKTNELDRLIGDFLNGLPNIPAPDVIAGGKENNQIVSVWGAKPELNFAFADHIDICRKLNLVDYERGAKLGGNGFWIYWHRGATLEWALLNYFIAQHLADGYQFLLPPHILNYECGYTAGQFPKFKDDVFHLRNEETNGQFLLPTSETAIVNVHRGEILKASELPRKYFAYSPCYRKEAGSYRSEERGMIRGHQFNKVEMFQYTVPQMSADAFDELVAKAEKLVRGLDLHYRVSKLAARDCSASMAKTYDIEVWIPSMNDYKEVSSISNAHDYQARRGNIRYKNQNTGQNEYVHTLNASGLATSRLIPALLEQHQQTDGSVKLPTALIPYLGIDRLD